MLGRVLGVGIQARLDAEVRALQWDVTELPVPTKLRVYTSAEWESPTWRGRFREAVMREAVWVYGR